MKRLISVLALAAVLAFSATTAFAADTGVNSDVTAHIMGQDLPLYSIQITGGSTITYNQLGGQTVDVGKKGETLGGDYDLVINNNGTQAVTLAAVASSWPSDGQHTFALASEASAYDTATLGLWEFAERSPSEPYLPGTYSPVAGAASFGDLASASSKSFVSRLTLPGALPQDAPTQYTWVGTVYATAAE